MRTQIFGTMGIVLMSWSTIAFGSEWQLLGTSLQVPDPSFSIVSSAPSLTSASVRYHRPIDSYPELSITGSYSFGGASRSRYGSYDESEAAIYDDPYADYAVDQGNYGARLRMHDVGAGVRVQHPITPLIMPYGTITGQLRLGRLTVVDELTGWTYMDPDDPEEESALYEVEPVRDVGAAVSVQGTVGVMVNLPPAKNAGHRGKKARRVPSAPPASPAPPSSQADPAKPMGNIESQGASEGGPNPSGTETNRDAQANVSPANASGISVSELPNDTVATSSADAGWSATGDPDGEATPAPAPASTKVQKPSNLGVLFEAGYDLSTDLKFRNSGSLDLGGMIVKMGIVMRF